LNVPAGAEIKQTARKLLALTALCTCVAAEGAFGLFSVPNTGSDDQPSINTMSNVTIRESGSKLGVGSCGLTISASGRVADCSQRHRQVKRALG
jgi:hypothetical protein